VKVSHTGFLSKVYACVKLQDGPPGWGIVAQPQGRYYFTSYFA